MAGAQSEAENAAVGAPGIEMWTKKKIVKLKYTLQSLGSFYNLYNGQKIDFLVICCAFINLQKKKR